MLSSRVLSFRVCQSVGRTRVTVPQRAGRQAATRAFGSSSGLVAALVGSVASRLALEGFSGCLLTRGLAGHAVSRVTVTLRPYFSADRASSNFG